MKSNLFTILICGGCIALSACSSFSDNTSNDHAAVCNQLKHQILFDNVPTANQTSVTSKQAELERANQSYNQLGC